MQQAKAFAPGNISCFFKLSKHENPRWRGSYGLGFTVNEGVIAVIKESKKTEITFNGDRILFPTVQHVIDHLTKIPITVSLTSPLPLGCGFGLSGASALATAYAVNRLLVLKKTKKQLAVIAHTADVAEKTGLGDVANQYFGGFLLKTIPSSSFRVKRIPLVNIPVYWSVFSSLSTKNTLANAPLLNSIALSADKALEDTKELLQRKSISFSDLIDLSYEFVNESGLLSDTKTKSSIEGIRRKGQSASMIVVGNAMFSDRPFSGAKRLKITDTPAHVL